MNLNLANAVRGLIGLSMVFAVGVALPTALPGVSEAEAAQPRSSIERRLRPGSGYFAKSPSRSSQPAPVYRPAVPLVQPGTAVVRAPQMQPHGQVIVRPVPQQGVVQPQQRVVQYPQPASPTRWITAPQR